LPRKARGTLNGAYNFFGYIGLFIFAKVGGILFDHVGPSAPFFVLSMVDYSYCGLIIVLTLFGYLREKGKEDKD
jgi:sugar phosphate permease